MTMHATVKKVQGCNLLVCDHKTSQEVLVHTPKASCFCVGDRVCIKFNGIMTMSIPPQITATCIKKLPPCRCNNRR